MNTENTAQEKVVDVLRQHGWNENRCACACGAGNDGKWDYDQDRHHAPHVAALIIAALRGSVDV